MESRKKDLIASTVVANAEVNIFKIPLKGLELTKGDEKIIRPMVVIGGKEIAEIRLNLSMASPSKDMMKCEPRKIIGAQFAIFMRAVRQKASCTLTIAMRLKKFVDYCALNAIQRLAYCITMKKELRAQLSFWNWKSLALSKGWQCKSKKSGIKSLDDNSSGWSKPRVMPVRLLMRLQEH